MTFTPMDFRRAMVRHLDKVDPPPPRKEKPPWEKFRTCRNCGERFKPNTCELYCKATSCQEERNARRKIQRNTWRRLRRIETGKNYNTCGRALLMERYDAFPSHFTMARASRMLGLSATGVRAILRALVGLGLLVKGSEGGKAVWRKKKVLTCPL